MVVRQRRIVASMGSPEIRTILDTPSFQMRSRHKFDITVHTVFDATYSLLVGVVAQMLGRNDLSETSARYG